MKKYVLIVFVILIFFGSGWFFLNWSEKQVKQLESADLVLSLPKNYNPEPWQKIIADFQIKYTNINVKLSNSENKADILFLNSDEFLEHKNKLAPISYNIKDFKEQFVSGTHSLIQENQILGLPIYMDILSLYFNPDLIESPPKTWIEFNEIIKKITKIDENGKIIISGAGLGSGDNIEHVQDILAMLMFQQGTPWPDFSKSIELNGEIYFPGERALEFYTSYANSERKVYTWDKNLENDFDVFNKNKIGMIFGFTSDKENLINAHIAPVPQITGSAENVNFAKYGFLAISSSSLGVKQALSFIHFASSKKYANILSGSLTMLTARKDLAVLQENDQILTAKTWPRRNLDSIRAVFAEMVEAYLGGRMDLAKAVEYGSKQMQRLMQ